MTMASESSSGPKGMHLARRAKVYRSKEQHQASHEKPQTSKRRGYS